MISQAVAADIAEQASFSAELSLDVLAERIERDRDSMPLGQHDGPMLEALKQLNAGTIHLPARAKDYPDWDRLALRFGRFEAAA